MRDEVIAGKVQQLAKELDEVGHIYVPISLLEQVLLLSDCMNYEVEFVPGTHNGDPEWRVSTSEKGQDQ